MSKTDENPHIEFKEYKKLHKRLKQYVNGACLCGRCVKAYEEKNSCSYRWQGRKIARENKSIYNFKTGDVTDKKYHIGKENSISQIDQVMNDEGKMVQVARNGYLAVEPVPGKEEWKVKSGRYLDKIVRIQDYTYVNFTVSAKVPYAFQVHHVLPCSALRDAIMRFKDIFSVIGSGLLKKKYNINHYENMIILPEDEKFCIKTGLPRHKEGAHKDYNKRVKKDVDSALKGYKSIAAQYDKDTHDKPKPLDVKKQLMNVSKKWYDEILAARSRNLAANKDNVIGINQIGASSTTTCD